MIYAARTAEGRWTGAEYHERTAAIIEHHAKFDEVLVPVAGLEPVDDEGREFKVVAGDLPTAKAVALQQVQDYITDFEKQFTDGYTDAEIKAWPLKGPAATAHLEGTPQDLIVKEAAMTGESPDDLARKVAAKAGVYLDAVAIISGLRRATEEAIAKATTAKAVQAILDAALSKANAEIAKLAKEQE